MHENQGNSVIFYAFYTQDGAGDTGLTVTITVYEVIRDGTKTEIVSDGATVEIGDGLYRYLLASGSVDAAAEYVAVFHTTDSDTDQKDIPAMWVIDRAGTEKLDTGVAVASLANDSITAAALKADAVTEIQNGLATPTNITAGTITTVTNLTNLPAITANWLTAAGIDATAVTELQAGLALEATITAIKGDGWTTETLAAIDVLIDAIKAKTDNLPANTTTTLSAIQADLDNPNQYKADVSALATSAALDAVDNFIDTEITTIDGIVDAIKVKTDLIPAAPAQAGEYTAAIAAVQADLDNPDQYKADVSALATTAHVQEVEDKVDIVDGIADAILDDTGTTGVLLSTSALGSIFDDEVIVGTYTFSDLLKIMAAALAGKATGGGTTEVTFSGVDGAPNVIVATVDANGNRSEVVLTV